MSRAKDRVAALCLPLSAQERAELAAVLLDSLEKKKPDLDAMIRQLEALERLPRRGPRDGKDARKKRATAGVRRKAKTRLR